MGHLTQLHGQSLLGGATTAVGGYVGVKQLQEQLRRIAYEFGKPSADPAQYDGTLTLGTVIALANAAPIVGDKIHAGVGQALDVVKLIKAPISKLPYGSTIINFILSPWIVDKAFSAVLGIIRLIPGGGGVATTIDNAMKAVKATLASAAAPIAASLLVVKKSSAAGLGEETRAGFCWIPQYVRTTDGVTVPGHWERARSGVPCASPLPPGVVAPTPTVLRVCSATDQSGCPGGVFVSNAATGAIVPTRVAPPPPAGTVSTSGAVVRDHRTWPAGKLIVPTDWSRTRTYSGTVPFASLAPADQQAWNAHKNDGPFGLSTSLIPGSSSAFGDLTVRRGAIAFKTFRGFDNARMGAFWDERNQTLKIIVVPEPSSSKYPWDYAADAVKAAAGVIGDAASAVGGAIADIATSTWNWIAENADDVYEAVKKYGCALVNNDIVVGLTAAGAGIVASPAASATVVSAAGAGKAACAAMEVAEVLYAIYQLMTMEVPKPPPLTTPTPPTTTVTTAGVRLLLPTTKPVVPLAKPRYPAGAITSWDAKLRRYRIAIPVGTQLNVTGFGEALGAAASHFEVETAEVAPPIVSTVPLTVFQKQTGTLPLYKNPMFWIALGTGAAAVGGGSYVLYRRRRGLTR